MEPVSQTKKHQGTSVMEQQPRGQSFRKLMTAAVNLIVTVKKNGRYSCLKTRNPASGVSFEHIQTPSNQLGRL